VADGVRVEEDAEERIEIDPAAELMLLSGGSGTRRPLGEQTPQELLRSLRKLARDVLAARAERRGARRAMRRVVMDQYRLHAQSRAARVDLEDAERERLSGLEDSSLARLRAAVAAAGLEKERLAENVARARASLTKLRERHDRATFAQMGVVAALAEVETRHAQLLAGAAHSDTLSESPSGGGEDDGDDVDGASGGEGDGGGSDVRVGPRPEGILTRQMSATSILRKQKRQEGMRKRRAAAGVEGRVGREERGDGEAGGGAEDGLPGWDAEACDAAALFASASTLAARSMDEAQQAATDVARVLRQAMEAGVVDQFGQLVPEAEEEDVGEDGEGVKDSGGGEATLGGVRKDDEEEEEPWWRLESKHVLGQLRVAK
jgi:hypothetical protein